MGLLARCLYDGLMPTVNRFGLREQDRKHGPTPAHPSRPRRFPERRGGGRGRARCDIETKPLERPRIICAWSPEKTCRARSLIGAYAVRSPPARQEKRRRPPRERRANITRAATRTPITKRRHAAQNPAPSPVEPCTARSSAHQAGRPPARIMSISAFWAPGGRAFPRVGSVRGAWWATTATSWPQESEPRPRSASNGLRRLEGGPRNVPPTTGVRRLGAPVPRRGAP